MRVVARGADRAADLGAEKPIEQPDDRRADKDPRDDDGDALANGVYFYKLIVEGDGKKETPVQRIAVLR